MPQTSRSVGGSRFVAELEDAARLERTRLADALHDDALQRILVARQDVVEVVADETDRDALLEVLDSTARSLRSLTTAMHDDALDGLPLAAALERTAQDAALRGRFRVVVHTEGEVEGIHDAAVRGWVRELLSNVVRHARARNVEVEVRGTVEELTVRVRDDGSGFDADAAREAARAGHIGLTRLDRVASELGGSFVTRADGAGTLATVRLPRGALRAQRRIEEELGDERRWSSALVTALQDALVVFRDHRVVQANDAFLQMTGFTRDEVLGARTPDFPFWAPEDRAENGALLAAVTMADGHDETVRLVRRDGTRFNARCAARPIDDGVGGNVGLLLVVRDLTEREQAMEHHRVGTELRTTIETTRRLSRLLTAAREGRGPMLAALGALLVDHLGWGDALINACHTDRWVVEWTSPSPSASRLLGAEYAAGAFDPFLLPRFEHGGAFHVPGEADLSADRPDDGEARPPAGAEPEPVRAGDLLLVPVRSPGGARPHAILSVAHPASGLRPTETQLEVLGAVAAHAAVAFELLAD